VLELEQSQGVALRSKLVPVKMPLLVLVGILPSPPVMLQLVAQSQLVLGRAQQLVGATFVSLQERVVLVLVVRLKLPVGLGLPVVVLSS
jgi:hypothetical protein